MSSDRRAIAEVGFTQLAELLQLPDGCEIASVFVDPYRPRVLQVHIAGGGWTMLHEGALAPRTIGTVRLKPVFGLQPEITWDMPR